MSSLYESKWATPCSVRPAAKEVAPAPITSTQASDERSNTASVLSGAAPMFSPLPPTDHNDAVANAFAQTGIYGEDLFDSTTYAESMQTRPQDDLFGDDFTPATEPPVLEPAAIPPTPIEAVPLTHAPPTRGRERERERGRGRGRGQLPNRQEPEKQRASDSTAMAAEKVQQAQAPENAPTGPRKETSLAVRGDRQATGGVRKPKLSEAELAEKMAQISIKNANLAAAHARAEADAASFADREAQAKVAASKRDAAAKVRAQSERKDRQQMMGEREKNRMRKLKAMEGREWDAEKNEGDFSKGGRFDGKGFAGDKTDYSDGREYLLHEPKHKSGPRPVRDANKHTRQEALPAREDFPALPTNGTANQAAPVSVSAAAIEPSSNSWADQVESSTAGT